MWISDEGIALKIAEALDLPIEREERFALKGFDADHDRITERLPCVGIELPPRIAQVAKDFDKLWAPTKEQCEECSYLAPYIESSFAEARGIGTFNEKGELIL